MAVEKGCAIGKKTDDVSAKTSALLTGQCVFACIAGELAAITVGVALGFTGLAMLSFSLFVAYGIVFAIGMYPVMRRERIGFWTAFRVVGLAETISIAVIETIKTTAQTSFGFGPMGSIFSLMFWIGVASVMIPAYFLAWPLNHLVLKALHRRKRA